jgi:hypothetical protein
MKVEIGFSTSIIEGLDRLTLLDIIPEMESGFTQRKEHLEYYFEDMEIDIDMVQLEAILKLFPVRMWEGTMIIQVI